MKEKMKKFNVSINRTQALIKKSIEAGESLKPDEIDNLNSRVTSLEKLIEQKLKKSEKKAAV